MVGIEAKIVNTKETNRYCTTILQRPRGGSTQLLYTRVQQENVASQKKKTKQFIGEQEERASSYIRYASRPRSRLAEVQTHISSSHNRLRCL